MLRHPESDFWYFGVRLLLVVTIILPLCMVGVCLLVAFGMGSDRWPNFLIAAVKFLITGMGMMLVTGLIGLMMDVWNTVRWRSSFQKLRKQGFQVVPKEWRFCLGPALIERPIWEKGKPVVWLLKHPYMGLLAAPTEQAADLAADEFGGNAFWQRRYR